MLRLGAPVLALLMLAGCTKTVAEMSYSERQALGAQIVKRCMDQGVHLKTKQMDDCTYAEAQREVATRERQARREDAHAASRRGPTFCNRVGNTVMCN